MKKTMTTKGTVFATDDTRDVVETAIEMSKTDKRATWESIYERFRKARAKRDEAPKSHTKS
jgi:hypothetical protein